MNELVLDEVQFLKIITIQDGIILSIRIPILSTYIVRILDNSWKDINDPLEIFKRQVLMFLKHEYLNVKCRNDTVPSEVFFVKYNKHIDLLNEIVINI